MMTRKRKVIIDTSDEDEEEESDNRRRTLRAQKQVKYTESLEEVEDEEEEEEKEEVEDEDNFNLNTRGGFLPVTCGTKEGLLEKKKLERGSREASIKCEGKWFTPTKFEKFGGKEASKKWKFSILYRGRPLQHWLKKGRLTTSTPNRRSTKAAEKKTASNHESDESSEDEEMSSSADEEDSDEAVSEDKDTEALTLSPVDDELTDRNDPKDSESIPIPKDAVVTLKRLPETELRNLSHLREPSSSSAVPQPQTQHLINGSHQSMDSWCAPYGGFSQSEEERDHNTSAETSDAACPSMSHPPIVEDISSHSQRVHESETPHEEAELTAVSSYNHDGAQSSHSEQETSFCRNSAHSSNTSGAAESADLDTMDIDQLKREKLKLQVKVLALQEMYYNLKISKLLNK